MKRSWKTKFFVAMVGFLATAVFMLPAARAVSMSDYTWYPLFLQQTVPPNILFIVDFSDAMLPAAYGSYPLSFNTSASYSSNYAGTKLNITDFETFDSTRTYFGIFDPLRCYVPVSPKGFGNPSNVPQPKATVSTACTTTAPWDGNFLNWLAMRKIDLAKKVLIGGRTLSASNEDGTADSLLGEPKTGQNGSTNTCNSTSAPCYRYVKFTRSSSLTGRYDTTLSAADTAWQATGTVAGPGTVETNATGLIVTGGTGTAATTFTSTFAVGDTITLGTGGGASTRTISAITNDSTLTVSAAFTNTHNNDTYTGTRTTNPGTVTTSTSGSNHYATGASTTYTTTFAVNDVVVVGTGAGVAQARSISTITSNTSMKVNSAFSPQFSAATSYQAFTPQTTGAGTVTVASGSLTTVTGTGTSFGTTFNVGDVIRISYTSPASTKAGIISTIGPGEVLTVSSTAGFTAVSGAAYTPVKPVATTQTLSGPGAMSAANGSTTVTGSSATSSTTFNTTFTGGDQIQIGTEIRTIASIASNTSLTVSSAFTPNLLPGQSYFNASASLQGPGTVTTTGTTTVTGSGTAFTTRFAVGETIRIGTENRVIQSITSDTVLTTTVAFSAASGANYFGPDGVYFGMGEGKIFVNGDGTADPFDAAAARTFDIQLDVKNTETDAYRKQQSLGLLQNLRTDNMRVSVMFTNSTSPGKAGKVFQKFDANFVASDITGIRNNAIDIFAPLAESAYEALCYYRNSQGACYSNSPADFTASVGASGDPFFFVCGSRNASGTCIQTINQTVSCCKSFILMISSGIPSGDGGTPDSQTPFGDLLNTTVSNVGLTTTQLDDVAYYGQTHDVRNQGTGITGDVPNTQAVTFYAVNMMGGVSGSTLLASAAKFGGFTDQNGDNLPTATGQTCTYPASSNLGSGTSTSSAEWDEDKDCTPDTYFDASEGGDLEAQINKAIASILKKAASGTSVSVLATSSTGEGAIYQAYFLPETAKDDGTTKTVKWQGFTQGLFIDTFGNIREDSDGDGRLILTKDKIITLSFNTSTNTVNVLRCPDADGDGKADSTAVPPCSNNLLSDIKPIWEAGKRLAYLDPGTDCAVADAGSTCRRILAWVDTNNNHVAQSSEVIEFTAANKGTLCPYLAGSVVSYCTSTNATFVDAAAITADSALTNCLGVTRATCAQTQASNLINFHRGGDGTTLCMVSTDPSTCLRDRSSKVLNPDNANDTTGAQKVWKLGDVVDATPTVVAAPKERYDVIYGDTTYTTFLQQYKNRRQVAYVGANDGMLHAVNVGFFNAGDDPCTTTGSDPVEHGYFTLQPFANNPHTVSQCTFAVTARTGNPKLGAELWAFVPHALLPHLKWYADVNYTHVAYVDLKPKVTDVRIFCGDSATAPAGSPSTCITGQPGTGTHPGGWGTIIIAGMRFGGSCGACAAGSTGGVPMTVTADFGSGSNTTRTFYAMYFVLDITDPEQDPVLLWSFTDARLGLTMSYPAVLRVSPPADGKTDPANARWLAVFGTGPTGYTGISTQTAQFFVVDIAKGPTYNADVTAGSVGQTSCSPTVPCVEVSTTAAGENVRVFSTGAGNSFMGDLITLDSNLDFKVDVIYAGNIITTGSTPAYIGKMYRLTTTALDLTAGTPTSLASWGITSSGAQVPTTLLSTMTSNSSTSSCAGSVCKVGPVTAASTVSADTSNNIWVFFGSGRFLSTADKTDTSQQYFFGVKDPCATSATCTQTTTSQSNNLLDVSNAVVCNPCAAGTNEVTGVGSNSDLGTVQSAVQNTDGWFTTLPNSGERTLSAPTILGGTVFFTTFIPTTDICVAAGSGNLYALYYLSGTAYKESVIGATTSGSTTTIKKSISLGTGLPSQMAVQIGSEGSGSSGSSGAGSGCAGRVTGFIQASTGVLGSVCGKPALSVWSRMLSWRDL